MVTDEVSIEKINAALLLLQRRIDRITAVLNSFSDSLQKVQTVEELKKLSLKI